MADISPIRPLRLLHGSPINEASTVQRGAQVGRVEERPPQEQGPAPAAVELSEFEKHYARAFPRFDRACGGPGVLTADDLDGMHLEAPAMLGQGDDDAALARTLVDYAGSALEHGIELAYKKETLIETTDSRTMWGGHQRHESEVPLRHHLPGLREIYGQEYRYDVFHEEYVDQFSDWDRQSGSTGTLSADDIDRLMEDPVIRGASAAALATLKELLREAESRGESLRFGPKSVHRVLADETVLRANVLFNQRLLLSRLWQQKRALVALPLLAVFENRLPDWRSVRQGGYSDCYLEACLVAHSHQHPYEVAAMVRETGSGGFEVRFGRQVVKVAALTDAQRAVYATSPIDGSWPTVIDKAWQRLPERSLSVLTGRRCRRLAAPLDPVMAAKIVELAMIQGGAAVLGVGAGADFQYYGVVEYEGGAVTLFSPWSGQYGLATLPFERLAPRLAVVEAESL